MSNYVEAFGFTAKPFSTLSDARFYYSNTQLEKAHDGILAHILERQGLIVLSGPAGIGKTALLNKCRNSAGDNVQFFALSGDNPSFSDILDYLCRELKLNAKSGQQFNQTRILKTFLEEQSRQNRIYVLVLEDADELEDSVLDNLLWLCSSPTSEHDILQIMVTGSTALQQRLHDRAVFEWELKPLRSAEVGPFIQQQLQAVGCTNKELFASSAIRIIAVYSKGIPGRICTLCDSVLFLAAVAKADVITAALVEEAMQTQSVQPVLASASATSNERTSNIRNRSADSGQREPQPVRVSAKASATPQTAPDSEQAKITRSSAPMLLGGLLIVILAAGIGWVYWQNGLQTSEVPPVTEHAIDTAVNEALPETSETTLANETTPQTVETVINNTTPGAIETLGDVTTPETSAAPNTQTEASAAASSLPPVQLPIPATSSSGPRIEQPVQALKQQNREPIPLQSPLLQAKPAVPIPAPLQSSPEAFIELHDESDDGDQ